MKKLTRLSNYSDIGAALYPGLKVVRNLKDGHLRVDISEFTNVSSFKEVDVFLRDCHLIVKFILRPLRIEQEQELAEFLERTDLDKFSSEEYFLYREVSKEEVLAKFK